jgi:colicin import membrane protein
MDAALADAGIGHNSRTYAEIVEADPAVIFRDEQVRAGFYAEVAEEVRSHSADLSTDKGRKAVASLAYGIARRKSAIDEAGKDLNEAARKQIGVIDAVRRDVRDTLDKLKDSARAPLDKWEEEQKARDARIEAGLAALREFAIVHAGSTAEALASRLADAKAFEIAAEFGERAEQAESLKALAVERLENAHADAARAEAERAELARLRAEQEARDRAAREAEEKAKTEAAEKERVAAASKRAEEAARAAAERQAREEREKLEREHAAALKAEQEKAAAAERARLDQEQRAKREKEAAEAEAARVAEEDRRRQADMEHRSNVMRAAKEALMEFAGLKEEAAKKAVLAISGGQVPNVTMRF